MGGGVSAEVLGRSSTVPRIMRGGDVCGDETENDREDGRNSKGIELMLCIMGRNSSVI